jgi:hypothetical protein
LRIKPIGTIFSLCQSNDGLVLTIVLSYSRHRSIIMMLEREIVMKKHYHVLQGMCGYMPDVNETCTTKRDAESCAKSFADEWRNDGEACHDGDLYHDEWIAYYSVIGTMQTGYRIVDRRSDYDRSFYIEISICYEKECSESDMP